MTPSKKRLLLFLLTTFLFTGSIFAQPANNNCINAVLITPDSACVVNTSQFNELKTNNQGITAGSYYLKVEGTCIDLKTRFQKQY